MSASTMLVVNGDWAHARKAVSVQRSGAVPPSNGSSQAGEPLRGRNESQMRELVCSTGKPIRLSSKELEDRALWQDGSIGRPGQDPQQCWMAVPLSGRNGRGLGLIEVSDAADGEFSGDDEALLVQLAQITSIAVENAEYAEERESNRMKDEFLWTLSHELRTPLNAILGWTELLRGSQLPPELGRGMEVIERSARMQAKLVEDMLDLSRVTTGKLRLGLRPTRLAEVIRAAMDTVQPAASTKAIEIESSLDVDDDLTTGDADRLQQVVWNLLSNAVKFSPSGGRVQIRLERSGSDLLIRVIDSGQGIGPEFLPYVFDRFRQADSSATRRHSGLGIGLTIARHIIELHGGSIAADSAGPGRGATFTVSLPAGLRTQAVEPSRTLSKPARLKTVEQDAGSEAGLDGITVLLVDDEADAREVVKQLLERERAEVLAADSARAGLEQLKQRRPDVLVSDIARAFWSAILRCPKTAVTT
jgi:signal transduction histidine kinase